MENDMMGYTMAFTNIEVHIYRGIKRAVCELDPDKAIGIMLETLGKELNGDRAYVFERNSLGGDDNTYEWTAEGITPEKWNLQNLSPEICKNWYRCFSENRNIVFDDIEKMRDEDPLQYDNLKSQNIHSIVIVPLCDGGQFIGFYGIDNPPKQELENTYQILQLAGCFISSILKRRDYMNQLRAMCFSDRLTELGNRYAMDEFILNIGSSKRVGIVYCDITGLKRTNDTLGHKMGDELICRAAESLKSVFGDFGLFRIGGDELLAICVDIDEAALQERIGLLRQKAAGNSVNLAIGAEWKENYENDLQDLINEAENLMYKEKAEFYRSSGIDRRK